jgi:uncharacterized membrane protein YagU involved in acid resistance
VVVRTIAGAGITGAIVMFLYLTVALAVFFHIPPIALYHWDASTIIGVPAAIQGGWETAILGEFFHLIVSLVWATVFVLLAQRFAAMIRYPILWGAVFGVAVWLIMSQLVVPLGHAPAVHQSAAGLVNNVVAHAVFFGIPVALVTANMTRTFQMA